MHLNDLGAIVVDELRRTVEVRREVTIDAFVVMPNHVHVIVRMDPRQGYVGATGRSPLGGGDRRDRPGPGNRTLGALVAGFKAATARRINEVRDARGLPVWQRGYHDHIIREHDDLDAYRRYIELNPARWGDDDQNPARCGSDPKDNAPTGARYVGATGRSPRTADRPTTRADGARYVGATGRSPLADVRSGFVRIEPASGGPETPIEDGRQANEAGDRPDAQGSDRAMDQDDHDRTNGATGRSPLRTDRDVRTRRTR
jgi:hypothetical protein